MTNRIKKITKNLAILASSATLFTACNSSYSPEKFAERASKSAACPEAETYNQDIAQQSYEETGSIPSTDDVVKALRESLKTASTVSTMSDKTKTDLLNSFRSFYGVLESEVQSSKTKEEVLKALGQLEFGTHPDKNLQADYSKSIGDFKNLAAKTFSSCEKPVNDENNASNIEDGDENSEIVEEEEEIVAPSSFFDELKRKTANLSHYGALKTFTVAYQSCEAIGIKPLTSSSAGAEGITVVGKHSSGRGNKREITSRTKVLRTHPYIKNFRKPDSSCKDSRAKPFIYDFGGKPYATSSTNSTLNFFKNAGSGSKELGVDCSGYVFSALMSAGLKLSPSKPLRARNVSSIPARHYMNPGSSMSCIQKVKAGKGASLQSGDIFASKGHIFMVNLVGKDPLGVEKARRNNKCSSITYKDFDFTILQSSPSKGAIGMNHMDGSDYLKGSSSMRKGFEKFARLDCDNKRKGRLRTPDISEASLVRHKMTSECVTSKNIKLDNESCVKRCSVKGV